MTDPSQDTSISLDERKWEHELRYRQKEMDLKQADQRLREREVSLKEREFQKSSWRSPLVVAVLATAIAAGGSAIVAYLNGSYQRSLEEERALRDEAQRKEQFDDNLRLEESKAQSDRILEMIKTGDADKAAENLKFLLDAGLVTDATKVAKIEDFLKHREPGEGPTLPVAGATLSGEIRCGKERWTVKTGTDGDAQLVNTATPSTTSIAEMGGWPAPDHLPENKRIVPQELTVWTVKANLTAFKLESDSDYRLVLADDAGNTIIAEIPSPACVSETSPFFKSISDARAEFDARFRATGQFQATSTPVTVSGVGFFDIKHGQKGVAPNAVELHPVLDITFNP